MGLVVWAILVATLASARAGVRRARRRRALLDEPLRARLRSLYPAVLRVEGGSLGLEARCVPEGDPEVERLVDLALDVSSGLREALVQADAVLERSAPLVGAPFRAGIDP